MARSTSVYRVFVASPGDLASERKSFFEEVEDYNTTEARHRGVIFEAVGWEKTTPGAGRPQERINRDLVNCDYLVLMLGRRWGTPTSLEAAFSSGTEEEFRLACDCLKDSGEPMKDIAILFKALPEEETTNADQQLQSVLNFRRELEHKREFMFKVFEDDCGVRRIIRACLAEWLRSHEKGLPLRNTPTGAMPPPGAKLRPSVFEVPSSSQVVKHARDLASEGRVLDAESLLAKATLGGDADAALEYGNLLMRLGRPIGAERQYEAVLANGRVTEDDPRRAAALGNLGILARRAGEMKRARELILESLALDERIGRIEGIAVCRINLGLLAYDTGNMAEAEMQAQQVISQAGHDSMDQNLIGYAYLILGMALTRRTRFDQANVTLTHAKNTFTADNWIALACRNLAINYLVRGRLDAASELLEEALEIDLRNSDNEGLAGDYLNLGNLCVYREDFDRGIEMYQLALDHNIRIGRIAGVAMQYVNLGTTHRRKGTLEHSESSYAAARDLATKLERNDILGPCLGGLAELRLLQGRRQEALELFNEALKVFDGCEMVMEAKQVKTKLEDLQREN